MPSSVDSIREQIAELPVVDAHEHLRGHDQSQPTDDALGFLLGAYLGSMLPFADAVLGPRVLDGELPEAGRWADFRRLWPCVRCTGYGQVVVRMLRAWGVDEDLPVGALEVIRQRLRERSPERSRAAYAQARIESSLTHYLAHPCCGDLPNVADFFAGTLRFDEGFHPLLGTIPLHEFSAREGVELVGRIAGAEVGDLGALEAAVGGIVSRSIDLGAVGLKDHAAYTRGLAFGTPHRAEAEDELRRLLAGECFEGGAPRLSDYLFDRLVRLSIEHRVPFAVHTGYLVGCADPKADVRHFVPVIQAYPQARFDLYHLNYPWTEDMIAVLKRFPNTWANACWTHIIDPEAATDFLRRALGAVPADRVFGFGGDVLSPPETVLAHLEIARDNIACALGEAVALGRCSEASALDVARMWLSDNAKQLYGL